MSFPTIAGFTQIGGNANQFYIGNTNTGSIRNGIPDDLDGLIFAGIKNNLTWVARVAGNPVDLVYSREIQVAGVASPLGAGALGCAGIDIMDNGKLLINGNGQMNDAGQYHQSIFLSWDHDDGGNISNYDVFRDGLTEDSAALDNFNTQGNSYFKTFYNPTSGRIGITDGTNTSIRNGLSGTKINNYQYYHHNENDWVAISIGNNVLVWDCSGGSISFEYDLTAVTNISGVLLDSDNNLYFQTYGGGYNYIQKYDSAGNFLWHRRMAITGGSIQGFALHFDHQGNIVSDLYMVAIPGISSNFSGFMTFNKNSGDIQNSYFCKLDDDSVNVVLRNPKINSKGVLGGGYGKDFFRLPSPGLHCLSGKYGNYLFFNLDITNISQAETFSKNVTGATSGASAGTGTPDIANVSTTIAEELRIIEG